MKRVDMDRWLTALALVWLSVGLAGCGETEPQGTGGAGGAGGADAGPGPGGGGADAAPGDAAVEDAEVPPDAAPQPCTTRITYGSAWMSGPNHPEDYDIASGVVTWDGSCPVDGAGNAYATLSNGWSPYFTGRSCVIALDYEGDCDGVPSACGTRVTYGPAWVPGPNHPDDYDDLGGALSWDGVCHDSGGNSWALLSNGWTPHFSGASACDLAFRHVQCGGLFANPAVDTSCPDPGVLQVGSNYYMVCTSGHYGYPIRTSTDLVHWTSVGEVFTAASHPAWAASDFWAPEMHAVGAGFVVYYSARSGATGIFAVGAAHAADPAGPFQDIGQPIVSEPAPGVIDAHHFRAGDGTRYLLWKVDGNAVGQPTPIKIQELAADGLSVVGSPTTILSNTLGWEGALVEGPWLIERGGYFYLFYSGNGYASPSYGVGVARATSPLGPFTKAPEPILVSKGAWAGPGHGSVLIGPSGDWVHVYHAWVAGSVGQSPGRLVLVDRLQWEDDWPLMRGAPSSRSQPLP